jgi:uncharacterized protein YjdB
MPYRIPFSLLFPVLFLALAGPVGCGSGTTASTGAIAGSTTGNSSTKTLTAVAVTPANVSLNVGATQQFAATGTYSDGSQTDVTSSATWASSNAVVATVNATGMLNALTQGTASVTAKLGSASATASATVNPSLKSLTSIAITPSTFSIALGGRQQLTATGNYSDNTQSNLTSSVVWSSSNGSVATVSSAGVLLAAGAGSVNVTATYNSVSATTGVTVTAVSTSVVTWHYDNERSGLNSNETTLTTANVNSTSFGKLFSYLVDGYVYAQPLYASNLKINGTQHNVVFVATEKDSVYAFDADIYGSGSPLWNVSLLQSGETPMTAASILPYEGITSTPTIDLASNTMYVVSAQTSSSSSFFRLHALDITTGAEKFGGPVTVTASVAGTTSSTGVLSLPSSCVQRAALLLADNSIFIGFGSCHSGWLLSYNAQTLSQTGVFNASPDIAGYGTYGGAGGIWMGGGGPAADGSGNIYVTTGNGPYNNSTSYGDSVLKFNAQLTLLDHFTPFDWAFLQCKDLDTSSGGLLLLPGTSYALAGGKLGKMYLVNTSGLGGMQSNDAGASQTLWFEQGIASPYSATCTDNLGNVLTDEVNGYQIYGTAAFFNNSVYLGAVPSTTSDVGPVRRFTYASGQLTPVSTTSASIAVNSYGTTPFISANGSSNGIVWIIDHGRPLQDPDGSAVTSAVLRAYDATDLTKEFYNSSQNSSDAAGFGIKFTSPIVANGKVFIGTGHDPVATTNPQGELDVYGLR